MFSVQNYKTEMGGFNSINRVFHLRRMTDKYLIFLHSFHLAADILSGERQGEQDDLFAFA